MTTPQDKLANASKEFDQLLDQHGDAGGQSGAGQQTPTTGLTDAERARLRKKYSALR